MGERADLTPPLVPRGLTALTSWLIPRQKRPRWLKQRLSAVENWWILTNRGEYPVGADAEMLQDCRHTLNQALAERLRKDEVLSFLRSPAAVLLAMAASLLALALASGGFHSTRHLFQAASTAWSHSSPAVRDAAQNLVVGHAIPVVFAAVLGIAIFIHVGKWHWYGFRYGAFYVIKLLGAPLLLSTLWVETASLILRSFPHNEAPKVVSLAGCSLLLVAAFGWMIHWSITDQHLRCPVCLVLLEMPVRIGSWASVFEPATTEMFCPRGHGTLQVRESEEIEPTTWSALDSSWQDLFEPASK